MAALKRLEAKIGVSLTVEGERALPTIVQRGRERERDQQDMKTNERG